MNSYWMIEKDGPMWLGAHCPQWSRDPHSSLKFHDARSAKACAELLRVSDVAITEHDDAGYVGCTCHSYNGDFGATPEVVVPLPDFVQAEQQRNNINVSVDACIAPTVQALWAHGIVTLGSCCGHGRRPPDLVLGDNESPERVASLLADLDPRPWGLYQWRDGVNEVRARVWATTRESKAAEQEGDQAEAEYRLRVVKSWLGSFPELKRAVQLWLVDQPIEGVVEQLAKEMGEFARDELGATQADTDAAIARDKEAEASDAEHES